MLIFILERIFFWPKNIRFGDGPCLIAIGGRGERDHVPCTHQQPPKKAIHAAESSVFDVEGPKVTDWSPCAHRNRPGFEQRHAGVGHGPSNWICDDSCNGGASREADDKVGDVLSSRNADDGRSWPPPGAPGAVQHIDVAGLLHGQRDLSAGSEEKLNRPTSWVVAVLPAQSSVLLMLTAARRTGRSGIVGHHHAREHRRANQRRPRIAHRLRTAVDANGRRLR